MEDTAMSSAELAEVTAMKMLERSKLGNSRAYTDGYIQHECGTSTTLAKQSHCCIR